MTRRIFKPTFLLLTIDCVLATGSFCLAYLLRFHFNLAEAINSMGALPPRTIAYAFWIMIGLLATGLYRARQRPRTSETVARVLIGIAIGGFCFILFFFMFPTLNTGRGVVSLAMAFTCMTVCIGRLVLLPVIDRNPVKTRVLVLGVGPVAMKIARLRRASDRRGFEIVGYIASNDFERAMAEQNKLLRPVISAEAVPEFSGVDEMIVALDERRGALPTEMLMGVKSRGIPVTDIISFLERETGRIDHDLLSPAWFVYTDAGFTDSIYRGLKRFVDVMLSAVIFVLASPIFLAVILLIWIEDGIRAGVFYRQSRIGHGGRQFELLKFRSMRVDAESESGPLWSAKDDDRITFVGKLIRRFRIDELPQLLNVIKGEMSIVGPRPERPEFVELLNAEVPMFNLRHSVRPGLTGWAQLNFPYGASVPDAREKLTYDLYYIKNASLILDVLIFLQTIEVVIWGKAVSMAGSPHSLQTKTGIIGVTGALSDTAGRDAEAQEKSVANS